MVWGGPVNVGFAAPTMGFGSLPMMVGCAAPDMRYGAPSRGGGSRLGGNMPVYGAPPWSSRGGMRGSIWSWGPPPMMPPTPKVFAQ